MARSMNFTATKIQDGLLMTRIAGILALGLAILLEALLVTPFCSSSQGLIAPLFLAAAIQIGAGLNAWRQERVIESVVLVAFGLFTCSQISQVAPLSALAGSSPGQGAFLLFWGVFAALVAAQQSDCGRTFHLLLAAVAATLLLKALILIFALPTLWIFPLLSGILAFVFAVLTGLKALQALRS